MKLARERNSDLDLQQSHLKFEVVACCHAMRSARMADLKIQIVACHTYSSSQQDDHWLSKRVLLDTLSG